MAKNPPRELQKVMIKNKMCLTFPLSSSSVSMTIVNVLCSQIIRQKSSIVSSRGPVEKRKKVMKRGFFFFHFCICIVFLQSHLNECCINLETIQKSLIYLVWQYTRFLCGIPAKQ